MKNGCRETMEEAVEGFHKRIKAPRPMVSVPNLSPEFMRLAIRLDVALCEFRDKFGGAKLLQRLHNRRFGPVDYNADPPPFLDDVYTIAMQSLEDAYKAIEAFEKVKPVTRGDRTLRRLASDLKCCPWLRQLDWLFQIEHQDSEERRCAASAAEQS